MIEHTFIPDWRHVKIPLVLTVSVVIVAVVFAFAM
jgi:hypothetical protein